MDMSNKKENQKVVRLNDKAYIINAFKGREGWSYLPRITKYVFPFIGYALNEDKNDEELISQVTGLMSGENADEVIRLIEDLVSTVQVDNSNIDFDKEFSQSYDTLIILVVEVIKLNYLDSFQRLVTNFQAN